jgi:hypothetical protein
MLKKLSLLTIILLLPSLPALSGTIDFSGSGDGGTWSWNGTGPLTATSLGMMVKIVGPFPSFTIAMPKETFTTGAFLGGSGTSSNPWTFGPGSPGSFTITGCVPPATTCTPVTLFSGEFDADQSDVQGSNSMLFTATLAAGDMNPALLTFLGLSSSPTKYFGTYAVTLTGFGPGSGSTASSDLVISPVPEPASVALIGIGLLGLAALVRRRKLLTT